jgi:outer membrane protein assembly factor BamE (lipoprotein component of BamABCDE complex)
MRRAVLIAFALLLVAAPAAGARIVVGKGIAGVRLSMTAHKVRQVLGTPPTVHHGHNDFGAFTQYVYPGRRLRVTFQSGNRVTAVATTSKAQKTSAGVGVGSSRADVQANVPHVHCSGAVCQVGQSLPGRRVTAFFLNHARTKVVRVLVGFVID